MEEAAYESRARSVFDFCKDGSIESFALIDDGENVWLESCQCSTDYLSAEKLREGAQALLETADRLDARSAR